MFVTHLLKNEYRDSLFLMRLSQDASSWEGVNKAVVVMGTGSNKNLLDQLGMLDDLAKTATSDDLIIAIEVETSTACDEVLRKLNQRINKSVEFPERGQFFHNLESAFEARSDINLLTISIPGEHAVKIARQGLELGCNIFLFSHHISIDDEVELKNMAIDRDLFLMGPDCGTTIIDGIGLGFANQVRRGNVGVVSASGSGLQEVVSLIHKSGGGISQAIGVGGRDMTPPVNGLMSKHAIKRLGSDPYTKVIILLAKNASSSSQEIVLEEAKKTGLPIIADYLISDQKSVSDNKWLTIADDFEQCAKEAIKILNLKWHQPATMNNQKIWIAEKLENLQPQKSSIRGLFTGGSFCAEAERIFTKKGIPVSTNLRQPVELFDTGNLFLDLGAEEYTEGRPHPFIDTRQRMLEIQRAIKDANVGILMLDVVLGWGCHPDPAGEIVSTLHKLNSEKKSTLPAIITSVCGTPDDPQNYFNQCKKLINAGLYLAESNSSAAKIAANMMIQIGKRNE